MLTGDFSGKRLKHHFSVDIPGSCTESQYKPFHSDKDCVY